MTPEAFNLSRKTLRDTQTRLAGLLGVSGRQIRRYESGATPVPKTMALCFEFLLKHEMKNAKRRATPRKRPRTQ